MAPISGGARAFTPGACPVAAGNVESAVPGFLDFELSEAKTRNFRFDQETFLIFASANSKSLNRDSTDCYSLNVPHAYARCDDSSKRARGLAAPHRGRGAFRIADEQMTGSHSGLDE
jgi:hypothetical protein